MLTTSVIGAGMGGNASLKALANSPHYDLRAGGGYLRSCPCPSPQAVRRCRHVWRLAGDVSGMPYDVVVIAVPPACTGLRS